MKCFTRLRQYLYEPSQCFVKLCEAKCCKNAPLPEDFLPAHKQKVVRPIYYATHIGRNGMYDDYESIIYNTTGNPIQVVSRDAHGRPILGIPEALRVQIKSRQELKAIIENYKKVHNYCPFLTTKGKCNVYKQRPEICREYGTAPGDENFCSDKVSRVDILKFWVYRLIYKLKKHVENLKIMHKNNFHE